MLYAAPRRRAPALALGLTAFGLAAAACVMPAASASDAPASPVQASTVEPLRCELVLTEKRGATTIEGRVSADRPVRGTYRIAIRSTSGGGRAMISQSGDFEARPGAPVVLGQTTLGGSRAHFSAELDLSVAGQRLTCSDRRGSRDL